MMQNISLTIAMNSNIVPYGESFEITATLTNHNNYTKNLKLPAGADYKAVFSCKIIDFNTKEIWNALEFSEQSFAAYWDTEIPSGKEHKIILNNLRFHKDNKWNFYLPVGNYIIMCIYNMGRALGTENGLSIQSNSIQFTVSPK